MRTTPSQQYSNTPIRRRQLSFIALALGALLVGRGATAGETSPDRHFAVWLGVVFCLPHGCHP